MPVIELAYFEWLASVHDHPPAEREDAPVRRRARPSLWHRLCRRSTRIGTAPGDHDERARKGLPLAADRRTR
jgi:hypothetical protein